MNTETIAGMIVYGSMFAMLLIVLFLMGGWPAVAVINLATGKVHILGTCIMYAIGALVVYAMAYRI
jgi:hypothetical protein